MQPWLFIYVFSFWFLDETWLFLAMLLTGFLNFTHLLFGSHWTVNMMPNKIEILEQLESHCISCSVSLSFVYFTSLTNRDAFVYPKHFSNNKTNAKKLKQPFWSPPPPHTPSFSSFRSLIDILTSGAEHMSGQQTAVPAWETEEYSSRELREGRQHVYSKGEK